MLDGIVHSELWRSIQLLSIKVNVKWYILVASLEKKYISEELKMHTPHETVQKLVCIKNTRMNKKKITIFKTRKSRNHLTIKHKGLM